MSDVTEKQWETHYIWACLATILNDENNPDSIILGRHSYGVEIFAQTMFYR